MEILPKQLVGQSLNGIQFPILQIERGCKNLLWQYQHISDGFEVTGIALIYRIKSIWAKPPSAIKTEEETLIILLQKRK